MTERAVRELRPHPVNQEIYGDHADTDLVASIRERGILVPLLVTEDGTVISGHRRLDAARQAGMQGVPVTVFGSTDPLDIVEALIHTNRYRSKTNEQLGREAVKLLAVEGERARKRQQEAGEQFGRGQQEKVVLKSAQAITAPASTDPPFPQPLTNEQIGRRAASLLDDARQRAHLRHAPTPPPVQDTGKAREKVAAQLGIGKDKAAHAAEVVTVIDTLAAQGKTREAAQLRTTLNDKSVQRAYTQAKEAGHIASVVQPEPVHIDDGPVSLEVWEQMTPEARGALLQRPRSAQHRFRKQETNGIEWALWSWNPVTGCKHDCSYCYARDIAARLFPQKFVPSFLPARLDGPRNTAVPADALTQVGYKNVFTCSMADLFGRWVPREWIEAILCEVRANPQWNFLFLTKFPIRLAEFEFPDNAWLGTTVDAQARIPNAEKAFARIQGGVKWLSCEPLLEDLTFSRLDLFDWVVIGGASASSQTPEFRPPRAWITHLEEQATDAGCRIYEKENLLTRIREYPAQDPPAQVNVPAAFKMQYLQRDVLGATP